MKRWLGAVLCVCAMIPSVAVAGGEGKKDKLHKGDTIYAFTDLSWLKGQSFGTKNLPSDLLTCDNTGCRYIVHACDPLFVASQIKDRTWVLPSDANIRKYLDPSTFMNSMLTSSAEMAQGMVCVSGGWSPDIERRWSLSRDECLAKIGKQAQPSPTPAASSSPTPSAGPAPSPSASPAPTPQ